MYKVLVRFKDLQDDGYDYCEGDTYPRDGLNPSDRRIKELSTEGNRRNIVLIEKIVEKVEELELEHVGGGYYELSNGEKVQGKELAIEAEKALR